MITTRDAVEFTITLLPEDVSPEDMIDDAEVCKNIYEQLNARGSWAWCCVKVTAKFDRFEEDVYLGCCSYESEEDFKSGGYYDDLCDEAFENLQNELERVRDLLS